MGGAGLVFTEAAAVLPEGRITPQDLGLWKDDHITGLKRIVEFVHGQGARAGVQLAHAGRKASMARPWAKEQRYLTPSEGGWQNVMAPSEVSFAENYAPPVALDPAGIQNITRAFARATERALEAGFDLIELHAAHGYLLHEFLSPLSNRRSDQYVGGFENRLLSYTDGGLIKPWKSRTRIDLNAIDRSSRGDSSFPAEMFANSIDWLRDRPAVANIANKTYGRYNVKPDFGFVRGTLLPVGLVLFAVLALGTGVWVTRRK